MCFLCCELVEDKNNSESGFRRASTLELRTKLLHHCEDRLRQNEKEEWSLDVKGRLHSCCDLVAEEAIYHTYCYMRFTSDRLRTMKVKEQLLEDTEDNAFNSVCHWLECSCENESFTHTG